MTDADDNTTQSIQIRLQAPQTATGGYVAHKMGENSKVALPPGKPKRVT
jgi:hypothetical protein